MKCEDAAAFVSALYDGERIPREAAEHLGACEACAGRLASYSSIGAELRRVAILGEPMDLNGGAWDERQAVQSSWWRKGRESMGIPRFAFASMLGAILLLSGGLVMVRARPNTTGSVLWLAIKLPPDGKVFHSALATGGQPGSDGIGHFFHVPGGGTFSMGVRFLHRKGDRVELGVKARYENPSPDFSGPADDRLQGITEQSLWIEPGRNEEVSVPGLGSIEFAGDFIDHKPPSFFSPEDTVDPKADEFRIVSPVLIRGKEVVFNFGGASSMSSSRVSIYWPGEGRFLFSSAPFKDAVRGSAFESQITFNIEGQEYVLLTAVPATRATNVWIKHEPSYKPSEHSAGASDSEGMLGGESPSDFPKE
jgi:hypothetical protein